MLVLLFCKLSEHYSQTNVPIIKNKRIKKKNSRHFCFINVKEIVHPKIKSLSSVCQFCHRVLYLYHHLLRSCFKPEWVFSSAEHKCYFEKRGKPNSCWFTETSIWFFATFLHIWCGPATVWLPTFFKISCFVFSTRNKLIQVRDNMWVSK